MIEKIDSAILAGCTRFSHWLQRLTGLTNYFVANVGISLVAISIMIDMANFFHQIFQHRTSLFEVIIDSLLLLSAMHRSFLCTKAQDQLYSNNDAKLAELIPLTAKIGWRLLFVAASVIDALNIVTAYLAPHRESLWFLDVVGTKFFFSLGLMIFYYFIIVDPLPPGKSKVRQWIEVLRGMPEVMPAPAKS